ncbi:AraC family transcriptional regulator [uncultured Bacteroides sp.]|uniref:helix-turn-helix domain-containing protein n=1 Tax=uncultured Bacteroides sp. TaxID=162156 RepID=UPI002AA77ED7|nr:AraC family transcriptional regulator [uncultured Bacteroides sp.]
MSKEKECLNFTLLNIGHAVHNADWNWSNVSSPFTRLYWVEGGSAKIVLPEGTYNLTPGHLYLIPSFTLHSYVCDGYFSLYYIHIYEEQTDTLSIIEQLNMPVEVEAASVDVQLVKRLLEINPDRELKRYDPSFYDNSQTLMKNISENAQLPYYLIIETKGILQQLFSRFLKMAELRIEVTDNRILKALRYIRKNIDKTININQLSGLCFLTDDHFIRLFKKEMKCTPTQYINQKKIERAQVMLIIDDLPIKEIAYNLSFDNISYFNKLFKSLTGLTPGEYKKGLHV